MNQELSEDKLERLNHIASLCAKDFGDAVFWARGVLQNFNQTYALSDCSDDVTPRYRESEGKVSENQVKMYPNPNTGVMNVSGVSDTDKLFLIDRLGVVTDVTQCHNQGVLSLAQFPQGLYLLKIERESEDTQMLKFSMIK